MPIYEYACEDCEHSFELIQRMGAPAPEACPACGEPRVRKLVSATAFHLKGSGWYKDGYGLGKSGSSAASSGGSGGSGGSESLKPTPKEESTAKAAAK
jgi:putative FmdB family regulatory protein